MIDLILQAATQQTLYAVLASRGLVAQQTDQAGQPIVGAYSPVPGFDFCWWAGSGKLMTKLPVLDAQGAVITPATFLAGFVMIARLTNGGDAIANPVDTEQWSRSKLAKFIKDNGVLGNIGGIPCYTVSNIRLARATDVLAFLAANNLPGHEWAGGNAL